MNINDFQPVQTTPYSLLVKLKVYFWRFTNRTLFRIIPNQIRSPRIILLQLFGAKVHSGAFINRKSNIEHPWNLEIGNLSSLGENSWAYCLDKISIGEKCTIGKDSYLITGSHDISHPNFYQTTKPIKIDSGTWVSTGCYILPGVHLKEFTVVAANSNVIKSTEKFDVIGGNPAKFIKKRVIT
ncbi:hypothetical protein [Christiangramia flava]|uniref:hypothetical protein n=1 Tax=Christiangramia flava TaxID=1486245 RepID=UPI0009F9BD4F|nr:hypothetical protein [Christiangramia flava]